MLTKLGLIAAGLILGFAAGGIVTMCYYGRTTSKAMKAMFMLQDTDLAQAEHAATQAYLNEPPEVGIWALENYLTFFEEVIEHRTAGLEDGTDVIMFWISAPERRWVSYVRLGLLYEKTGDSEKQDEAFQKAAEIFGHKVEGDNVAECLRAGVERLDEETRKSNTAASELQ